MNKTSKGKQPRISEKRFQAVIDVCKDLNSYYLKKETKPSQQVYFMDKWSPKYGLDCCKGCGATEVDHMGKGLCNNCYNKHLHKVNKEYKDRQNTKQSERYGDDAEYRRNKLKQMREFAKTTERKAYMSKYKKILDKRYPEKKRAREIFHLHLRTGRIKKGNCLIGIGYQGRIEGHHPDYSKPLLIMWFCSRHHRMYEGRQKYD